MAATKPQAAKGARDPPRTQTKKGSGLTTAYLVLYNILSAAAWAYPFVITVLHICDCQKKSPDSWASRILAYAPKAITGGLTIPKVYKKYLPAVLNPYVARAMTTYQRVGPQVKWIQTAATLEILHSIFGLVRSPLQTTVMQVFSRLFLVWGIVDRFPLTHIHPIYSTMILSWSFTEIIRYTFYALNLLGFEPYPLLWVRYTTFYLLYLTGAGSEMTLIFSTLPLKLSCSWPFFKTNFLKWQPADYGRAAMFFIWWPALFTLYTHMMKQRRRVLGVGPGRKLKSK